MHAVLSTQCPPSAWKLWKDKLADLLDFLLLARAARHQWCRWRPSPCGATRPACSHASSMNARSRNILDSRVDPTESAAARQVALALPRRWPGRRWCRRPRCGGGLRHGGHDVAIGELHVEHEAGHVALEGGALANVHLRDGGLVTAAHVALGARQDGRPQHRSCRRRDRLRARPQRARCVPGTAAAHRGVSPVRRHRHARNMAPAGSVSATV